ncbi:hypothetical protein [Enterobacter sp. R1(2018)]|uniref:hypothetical protein n=1 Tax=Enterobacter sp. R1(2018) TaxID=2447891 RepID=UPI001C7D22A6|nr:hypothetical protein [Enterobacter sp. R1(2018)]
MSRPEFAAAAARSRNYRWQKQYEQKVSAVKKQQTGGSSTIYPQQHYFQPLVVLDLTFFCAPKLQENMTFAFLQYYPAIFTVIL